MNNKNKITVLVRQVSPMLAQCELTHLARGALDAAEAAEQHKRYAQALEAMGARIVWLPPLPDHADSVFVEDTAVVVPEMAVIARPGAASRQAEVESTAQVLSRHRPVQRIVAPGCLDGGDVLRIGRTVYVGASTRTNAAGIEQLGRILTPLGYQVRAVPVTKCLHLKTGVTFVAPHFLVFNAAWIDPADFQELQPIAIDPAEPFAANTLTLGEETLVSADFPRTAEKLQAAGIAVRQVGIGELHKAEAGLTCLSIVIQD